jgi:anti-sigma regulatory factor (Ser/Thr protein kinase)
MSAGVAPFGSPLGITTRATVPAQLRFVETVRAVVRVAMDGYGADMACETDLALAIDELAACLIAEAYSPTELGVAVVQDPTRVYIELLVTDVATGAAPTLDELSRGLLDATTDAHAIHRAGWRLVGRLQRRLEGPVACSVQRDGETNTSDRPDRDISTPR